MLQGGWAMKIVSNVLLFFGLALLDGRALSARNVYVNQVGYLPDQQKLAYLSQSADSFFVVSAADGRIYFRGRPALLSSGDAASGLTTYLLDFSAMSDSGTFRIASSEKDTSYSFRISDDAFRDVFATSLKGFYFQRCGTELTSQFAGKFARASCHLNDGTFHSSTGISGSKAATGGWHDAGDYGKYVVNAGITVGTLLMAYEQTPARFERDDLGIPESGNSVPDLLDEVRYELNWLLEMQDTTDGGVYFKVTPAQFAGFIMPSSDNSTRYIYQKSTTATGDFAAVTAMAARIYSRFDSSFSRTCLERAELAWQYLSAHPEIVPAGGFHNPSGTATGEYGDGDDSDERLWGAAELYITTGADSLGVYFENHYADKGVISYAMGWQNVRTLAEIEYLSAHRQGDSTVKSALSGALLNYCGMLAGVASKDGFNVTLNPSDYYWGSNSVVMNNAVLLLFGYRLSGAKTYYNAALSQLNYILGCNMHNMTFITGVGANFPMHIHHRPSAADGIADPVPGLLAGGPNHNVSNDPVLQTNFSSSTPPAACYIDDQGSYGSNEICINWNAPLVLVSGYLDESPATPVRTSPAFPKKFGLEQNFPNSFNSFTNIEFQMAEIGFVTLKVYDVLGRRVATLADEVKQAGRYRVIFDGSRLASGVYFYKIMVHPMNRPEEAYVETRKLMMVK